MRASTDAPVVVWFRRDLRLADHGALWAAAESGQPVLPVFILSPSGRQIGAASRWWLHHSLAALGADLAARRLGLVLRRGRPEEVLAALCASTGARRVLFNRALDPQGSAEEKALEAAAGTAFGLDRFDGDSLQSPGSVRSAAGNPLRVFTPFWRACLARPEPPRPRPAPRHIRPFEGAVASASLQEWRLLPTAPDWAAGFPEHWKPGEAAAADALGRFIENGMGAYPHLRDRPDMAGTSRLSPHLHFGEVSPRQVWHAVRSRVAGDSRLAAGSEAYLRELGWREFSLHLLDSYPELATRPLQAHWERFPWRTDAAGLRAWQGGETGYPLVDAGMRELWTTGWMHNRVRMIAASFLVKHLLLDWRQGEAWFWDTLVDADAANNAASWQWVAGCGADAAPYFRIFNPVIQGARFDPEGQYVRRWIPQLGRMPARYIHAPWTAPATVLAAAGLRLGADYPVPIVDHAAARARALAAYAALRRKSGHAPPKGQVRRRPRPS